MTFCSLLDLQAISWGTLAGPLAPLAFAAAAYGGDLTGVPRIIDGDTVEVAGRKVRLEGIDSPETDQLCLDAKGARWACGVDARGRLIAHVGGKLWTCHVRGTDRYGRSLGTCFAGGEDLQRWMVKNGWALSFVRYSHAYDSDERAAKNATAGLWSGAFIAPWDWRARNKRTVILGAASVPVNAQAILLGAASAAKAPSPECTIKGNLNRQGVCIYHVPGGRFYAQIRMDLSKGKRWFCTVAEAEAAGCRRSKL